MITKSPQYKNIVLLELFLLLICLYKISNNISNNDYFIYI